MGGRGTRPEPGTPGRPVPQAFCPAGRRRAAVRGQLPALPSGGGAFRPGRPAPENHGIALRDCSNYPGLENGGWFRAGVRTPEEHALLAEALRAELKGGGPAILRKLPKPALMIQGTCSDAGKSVLTAALCRIFLQDGHRVAPFKAQNMALNSGVTALGEEMGRAQMVQAQACRIDPDARMNPILLKPHSNTGSQVIVMGRAVGHMEAREYLRQKALLAGRAPGVRFPGGRV